MEIIIDGDATGAKNAASQANSAMNNLAGTLKGLAIGGGILLLAKKGFDLLSGAIKGTISFLNDCVDAAADSQLQLVKLNTALKATGNFTTQTSKNLVDYAAALQKTTAFEDDAIVSVEAMLATFKLTEEEIKIATQATLDLAAATGQDLQSAAILMGKAMVGETGMLKRYGIMVDENKYAAEGWKAVIEEINTEFGGQAVAQADTYTGRLEQMKNVFGDLKEDIGNAFLPTLQNLMEWFIKGPEIIDPMTGAVSNLASPLEKIKTWAGEAAQNMSKWLELNWENIVGIAENAFTKIAEFISIIMSADYTKIKDGMDDLVIAFGSLIGDESSGLEGAEIKYQSFVDSIGTGLTKLSEFVITVNALWTTVNNLMVGVIATWDTIWQGVLALETFVDSGFKDTSGFDKFHESMGILEQVSISAYDNIAKAWEKQQKLLDEINTKNAQKELETMGKEGTDNFSAIQKSAADAQKQIDSMHGKDFESHHTIITTEIFRSLSEKSWDFVSGGGTTSKQSGGSILGDTFASDLNIPLFKGEAVLPASVVRAIKQSQPSFAGLDASGGGSITNQFNISELVVREEADIDRIAEKLYTMQQTRARLA